MSRHLSMSESVVDESWSMVLAAVDEAAGSVVAPSPLSGESARSYVDAPAFRKFGEWVETVTVARVGTIGRIAKWLAVRRRETSDYHELWRRCQRANPSLFATYRVARLKQPSFFLPAGEVVFEVHENPTQIPDRPPRGVLLRHWEATTGAADATFYFLRPVFTADPEFRLYTPADLREEAAGDRDEAIFTARLWGGPIRAADATRRLGLRAATLVLRGFCRLYEALMRRHNRRMAQNLIARMRHLDTEELLRRVEKLPSGTEMIEFQRELRDMRTRLSIDPILCFELPHRPGELWFEAHWFEGRDGRLYVGY